ncbi:DinI-like family protein [Yersinia rohdei]|uniref:DinI-like family protein n=1 Tax=Yersinia rohdei TaxID=29485 RepID=UPI0005DAC347|nr:DinI-like family protein [Yersinia rohdei]CQJ54390.1 Uncharacterised protein [Yersinia rohdei]
MNIKISISDADKNALSVEKYDAYVAELSARVEEIYPESELLIVNDCDVTSCTVSGFHDNETVHQVVHELQLDVAQNGYWRK